MFETKLFKAFVNFNDIFDFIFRGDCFEFVAQSLLLMLKTF